MKPLPFLALLVVLLALSPAQAQQRVKLAEFGISVEIPAVWNRTKTYEVTEHLPATGLYHVMNLQNGQGIAVRQDACAESNRRKAWEEGELATKLHAGDVLKPLTGKEPINFGKSMGFEMTRQEGDYMAYVFYLARGKRCYEVMLSSPEEIFEESESIFQQVLNSLSFATIR